MEWVETTGSTLEEAKEAALDQLGVAEDDAEFEIVDEPKAGLFGRTRGEARVRARVRPATPRGKTERRPRKAAAEKAAPAAQVISSPAASPAPGSSSQNAPVSPGAQPQLEFGP